MPVTADRAGNNVVVTITEPIADILSGPGTAAQKRVAALERAHGALADALKAVSRPDAEIDAPAAKAAAEAARIKAARPTGSL